MKRIFFTTTAILSAVVLPGMAQSSSVDWVPYTANYTETAANPGRPQRVFATTESRSNDGSVLTIVVSDRRKMGKLWESSGDHYDLDFINKQAIYKRNTEPRAHLQLPSSPPLRSDVIAGISCSVYLIHLQNGAGNLCVDTSRDILIREEIHMTQPGGGKSDLVKEMTTIDFSKPSPNEKVGIPAGFRVLKPSSENK